MAKLKKLFRDLFGLAQVCGPAVAGRWVMHLLANLGTIRRQGNLQVVDQAMGHGPFRVTLKRLGLQFRIKGPDAISGIREMYVRDTYLHGKALEIRDGDCVVDLGANMGNFTNLALAHGPNVQVIAVEPSQRLNDAFRESLALNTGSTQRTQLVSAFVGLMADKQHSIQAEPEYADAEWLSEDELIERAGIERVDFLKCDIEGGEYGLLTPHSKLLAMTQSLAVEVHQFAGDVDGFLQMLRDCGFAILAIQRDPDGTVTALAKRQRVQTTAAAA